MAGLARKRNASASRIGDSTDHETDSAPPLHQDRACQEVHRALIDARARVSDGPSDAHRGMVEPILRSIGRSSTQGQACQAVHRTPEGTRSFDDHFPIRRTPRSIPPTLIFERVTATSNDAHEKARRQEGGVGLVRSRADSLTRHRPLRPRRCRNPRRTPHRRRVRLRSKRASSSSGACAGSDKPPRAHRRPDTASEVQSA